MCAKGLAVLCFVTVLSVGMLQGQDASSCSDITLRGSYGLRATGNTTTGGALIVLGRFSFDGAGNLTARLYTRQPNGATVVDNYSGSYTVGPDCTVTDVWKAQSTGVETTHFSVIVNQGKGYYVLNTTEGAPVIISGEATKQ